MRLLVSSLFTNVRLATAPSERLTAGKFQSFLLLGFFLMSCEFEIQSIIVPDEFISALYLLKCSCGFLFDANAMPMLFD